MTDVPAPVRRLRRLVRQARARREERVFVLEGPKLIGEALSATACDPRPEVVFVDVSAASAEDLRLVVGCERRGAQLVEVPPGVLQRALDTVTPQPIAAMVGFVDVPLEAAIPVIRVGRDPGLVAVLVDVRDPGNAGTLMRSALAAGAAGVVLCAGSVDLYNPKTLRASAGSVFHLPVASGAPLGDVLGMLEERGYARWGTAARGGAEYSAVDLSGPVALVLGNEANGLAPSAVARLDGVLTIPMAQGSESLNVGVAGSVICFEAARQRRTRRLVGRSASPAPSRS